MALLSGRNIVYCATPHCNASSHIKVLQRHFILYLGSTYHVSGNFKYTEFVNLHDNSIQLVSFKGLLVKVLESTVKTNLTTTNPYSPLSREV